MTHPPQPPPGEPQPGQSQQGYGQPRDAYGTPPPPPAAQPGGYPAQPAMQGGYAQALPNPPGAVPALVVGLIGVFMCQIAAPFAFFMGRNAERAAAQAPGAYSGVGMATAGKILGIVGTVILALFAGLFLLWLVFVIILGVAGSTA